MNLYELLKEKSVADVERAFLRCFKSEQSSKRELDKSCSFLLPCGATYC